ncbi:MAG TPA: hypothetical protein VNU68_13165 [Verrucomicrobiae bacterium]|nr:hypothetical protein [Verrucomicrobiae bacterium]
MNEATTSPARPWRSIGAVFLGFLAIAILSLATDQVLHVLKVYPPWGQPMQEPGLNLLALSYRIVYGMVGSYLAARFAPRHPMRHALILGMIGFLLSTVGAIAIIGHTDLGPAWYPIALVITALPCAWLGGLLHRRNV